MNYPNMFFTLLFLGFLHGCNNAVEKLNNKNQVKPTAAVLQSITVTPTNQRLLLGNVLQLTATGNYSDNSTQDLTTKVTWSVLPTNIADVDNAGLVTAKAIGSTTIIAAFSTSKATIDLTVISKIVLLPKTGQTTCYDVTTFAAITCGTTSARQDGELQTGTAWPTTRFTTHSSNCMIDNLTGLMWVKNANLLFNPTATPADTGIRNWQQALDFSNNLQLCGYSDWRLPNRIELYSLINFGVSNPTAWLIDNGFTNVKENFYWSSTTWGFNKAAATQVALYAGYVDGEAKSFSGYVWPVRTGSPGIISLPQTGQITCTNTAGDVITCANTGQDGDYKTGQAWPTPRFTVDDTNNCILDNLTGLTWARAPENLKYNWENALKTSNELTLCGFDDWRLPNINELNSLVNSEPMAPATPANWLNDQGFTGMQNSDYWSSTNDVLSGTTAYLVDMFSGNVSINVKSAGFYVLSVRGGE